MTHTTLEAVCESVRYGFTASASDAPIGPKFLRITDIVPDQINWETVPYCQIDDRDKDKYRLEPGDIVVARTGATVGYAKLIREPIDSVFASYLVRFRVDQSKADPGFVGKIVESQAYKSFVRGHSGGAAQPNASAPVLGSFSFVLPSKDSQKRIFEIASAYDDFIENNRRRIKLLEESARLLYREWFVHLRFPGHEHVKVVDGVPEGWGMESISDLFDTTSGGTPSRSIPEYFDGAINWVKTQELDELFIFDTEERISEATLKNSAAKLFPAGTLLVSIYGGTNIGRTGLLAKASASNQACVALMPKRHPDDVLFVQRWLQENRDHMVGLGQGAAQTNISLQTLRGQKMLVPNAELMDEFTGSIKPMYEQIANLCQQNTKLREARDLLLPRLMSGEIAV